MHTVAVVLTAAVALVHVYIVVLEMVLWETPRGRETFGTTPEEAASTAVLAANQGLYNGFLVAGLVLGLLGPADHRFAFSVFTLACVVVAGAYGAVTVSRRILWVQAVPAVLALGAWLLS
ncbi:DUF1304 domain-containing protein [Phycicoccus endophyticus]|uniref:DUF1304 domain-containing protein n=1 Tax=Phycicoccus endophyticus TaxID=1690220 RepID=A0A7G9R0C4_9MICO|nr:DUF1304 domain-containing protein [Phycicoccus endophyticus]NHI20141.1 DUF1304 domain-containing protein [Phycicoccus endophyticus]QNN49049.1 DUF1304 domain-containing protein [Phycicoccus endophyticus]GGL38070.1 membrane protein [Phycicoccus endophyticus]